MKKIQKYEKLTLFDKVLLIVILSSFVFFVAFEILTIVWTNAWIVAVSSVGVGVIAALALFAKILIQRLKEAKNDVYSKDVFD